jgi:hypothetical protein
MLIVVTDLRLLLLLMFNRSASLNGYTPYMLHAMSAPQMVGMQPHMNAAPGTYGRGSC